MLNLISNTQQATKLGLKVTLLATMVSLAACGGGGSEGFYNNGSNGGSTGGTDNGGATTAEAVNINTIAIYDAANKETHTVTAAGATAKVKVTDKSGKGISGALVTFTGGGLAFGTSNGAVLTNADGEASISIKPVEAGDTGSYALSAQAEYNGVSAKSKLYTYSLQAVNIILANLVVGNNNLESGASTNITLKTQDASTNVNQNNVAVNFSASCGTFEPASVVSSNQGDVTSTYKSLDSNGKLCEGKQVLTAAVSNASATQTIEVNIAAITANSLVYSSTGTVNMGSKNSGSPSSGQIEFTVYANGTVAANQSVNIDLYRGPDDISFVTEGNRTTKTLKSDASGKVLVDLFPGTLPGPVEIKASLAANPAVFVLSKNVAVSTGRVSQQGLSISVSKNSLEGDVDGDSATVTARLADRVGNPVPDGTVISFVSEGGSIDPNCGTVKGICTVQIRTQNPRPEDNRISVIAYVEGDKKYTDNNGDNVYTPGVDKLDSNIGDFFRDDNENNIHDAGEFIYRRGDSGTACAASTIGQPNITGTCNNELDAVLRQQVLFAFAHSTPTFVGLSGIDQAMSNITGTSQFTFQIYGNNILTVPMPSNTAVSAAAVDKTSKNGLSCTAEIFGAVTVPAVMNLLTPSTFPQTNNGLTTYQVIFSECVPGDYVRINVATPAPDAKTTSILVPF